jgi:hypothetical protein
MMHTAATQGNPIQALQSFLKQEEQFEQARLTDKMRFVG